MKKTVGKICGFVAVFLYLQACNNYGTLDIIENAASGKLGYLVFPSYLTGTGLLSLYGGNCADGTPLQRANCTCNQMASEKNFGSLGNQFVAWLSDSTTDAVCNAQGMQNNTCSSDLNLGPLVSLDDNACTGQNCANRIRLLAESVQQITTKGSINPVFSSGNTSPDLVWTGTGFNGRNSGVHCLGWTSNAAGNGTAGEGRQGGTYWTSKGEFSCSSSATYYCIEVIK